MPLTNYQLYQEPQTSTISVDKKQNQKPLLKYPEYVCYCTVPEVWLDHGLLPKLWKKQHLVDLVVQVQQ